MEPGLNLFVAPLDKRINDVYLENEFSKFGEILSACVAKDENRDSKGYGFVHFCSEADGTRAMNEMKGKILLGKAINVLIANKQQYDEEDGRYYNSNSRYTMWFDEEGQARSTLNDDVETVITDFRSEISDYADDLNSTGKGGVKERMRKLFETQSFTDVIFYPKNDQRSSISAHRAVLAIGSPLFEKMLYTDHDKNIAGMKMEVHISNLAFDAFTNIVKYLYTDEVFFESDTLVQEILDGARQFQIPSLVSRCKRYFDSLELTTENVCLKLQFSISNKIDILKERCIEFIQRNTFEVINSSDFRRCSQKTVRTICNLQALNLRSEKELLEAVINWLHEQPPHNREQLLKPLIKCIRFLTFTVTELGDILKKYPTILTAEDGLSIMLCLYNPSKNPNFKSLPSWCNKCTMRRCIFLENPNDVTPNSGYSDSTPAGPALRTRVLLPLKPDNEHGFVEELISLLQMRCIGGFHTIKAIHLAFGKPLSEKSMINNLSISVHCHPSGFRFQENIQIINSENIRIEFSKSILCRRGDIINIEAEAKNIKCYRFLQFDDSCQAPLNPHFVCSMSSRPKLGKLYFIKEIEYEPRQRCRNIPNVNRGRRGKK